VPPRASQDQVAEPGKFPFATAHLDHGHIYGQCGGLIKVGGCLNRTENAIAHAFKAAERAR
jgi:hypothetical protein